MKTFFAMLALLVPVSAAWAQEQDLSKVEVKTSHVAGSVYMLQGAGGNIGVSSGPDGLLMIDDEFAPLAPKIQAALKALSPKPLRWLLNTHWHGDHTGGNALFPGSTIVAQENVRTRLAAGGHGHRGEIKPVGPEALPVVTFNDRAAIYFNGEEIRAIHLPSSHTDGDTAYYFVKSNVVHMGDDFFNGHYPFVDIDSGGSVRGYVTAVDAMLKVLPADAKVIPGHGDVGTVADLKSFRDMVSGCIAAVDTARKQGKSLEQMKKDKVLAAYEKWASGFVSSDVFTELVFRDAPH
jgi:cyclase